MKIIAGTNHRRKEDEGSESKETKTFTKETAENPKSKANALKIPKSVTDDPQKHHLQHTVRQIHNGYIQNTTYNHPDHGYVSHEVYHAENPLDLETDNDEKNPFGRVKGL